ncbi:MAG: heavy metal translocating P-type ATPase [Halioglobus sp.]
MCCPGCSAVARMIAGSGLESFYRQRTAFSQRPDEDTTAASHFAIYDDPQLASTFCATDPQGLQHAAILVGGITCAACTWLIEQALASTPSVERATVNLGRSRLDITFNPERLRISEIFWHLDQLGYRPLPFEESTRRQQARSEYSQDLRRLGVAGLGMMQVGMFAIALHAGDIQGMDARYESLLRWVSLPVATFVVLYSARPFFTAAWRHLRVGALVMDLPVALAIGLALLASAWATLRGTGQVYFDSVVMFTFFLLLGRFVEKRVRQRSEPNWQTFHRQLPDAVKVRQGDSWRSVPRIAVREGDELLVRSGEMVPIDARISSGSSSIREDAFTGESLPRAVTSGDVIYAGTLNLEGVLQARALGGVQTSRLATLQKLVDSPLVEKPQLVRLADRVASWFVAGMLLIASLTAIWWTLQAPGQAFWVVLSVLVISCPCALALATPAALSGAAGALQHNGVLVRGENSLESLTRCTHLVFDKTGTLTRGKLALERVIVLQAGTDEADVLSICATLQHHSSHPIAGAFADEVAGKGMAAIRQQPGAGMEGRHGDAVYRMGSVAFCRELAPAFPEAPDEVLIWVALCRDTTPVAWLGLADEVRPEAAAVVNAAKQQGLTVELLTGDSSGTGPNLARELDIANCNSGQSPEDKLAYISSLQARGAIVCMVGDGVNDGPVLRRADASFAVAGASDLARAQADFILLGGNLHAILHTFQLARRCRRIIKQNIAWALIYNICAIPLAAMGMVPPWIAAIGMSTSSLLVVGNSLRLTRASTTRG